MVDQFDWITDVKQSSMIDPRVILDEVFLRRNIVWGGTPEMLQDLLTHLTQEPECRVGA